MKRSNKKKVKSYLKIIKNIENIRKKNNVNWMNLLRLAFKHSPEQAAHIMSRIYVDDNDISKLVKRLAK